MKIHDKRSYVVEENYFKSAHQVVFTDTAEGTWEGDVVPHGAVYPANDATARGIVLHDTEVGMPMALVVEGHIYENRLPEEPAAAAKTALKHIAFYNEED